MADNPHYPPPRNTLDIQLNKDRLDRLNYIANSDENITQRTILTSSNEFTNNIIKIIDDIVTDISEMNNDYEDEDTLDWMVKLMNVIYKIFDRIMNKENCLNIGILLIIISLFIHYFNITQ